VHKIPDPCADKLVVGENEFTDVSDLEKLCTRFPEDFGTYRDSKYLEPEESGPSSRNSEDELPTEFDVHGNDAFSTNVPTRHTISLPFSAGDSGSDLTPKEEISLTDFDDEPTPPASLDVTVDALWLKTGVLEKTDLLIYPVLRGDSEPDSSDFANCVTLGVLDFFTEAVSFEVHVLRATDPSSPSVCCDPEDNVTDSGYCTPSGENLKDLLDLFTS